MQLIINISLFALYYLVIIYLLRTQFSHFKINRDKPKIEIFFNI